MRGRRGGGMERRRERGRIFILKQTNTFKKQFIRYCVFFPRIFNILLPLPGQQWAAAIGCTENGQPIRVTVHLDLRSAEMLS